MTYAIALSLALTLSVTCFSQAEVSTSDPLWDWKYDAIERLSLALGERTVSNTRPMSRLEMAGIVLKLAAKTEVGDDYYGVLLKRLEDDLREEITSITERTTSALKINPLRWVRVKAVHSDDPFQLENDYGFKAGDLSIRGELSTSGTLGFLGYELRPQYNLYKADARDEVEDELDFHSGYLVLWLKNLEIEVGKDSLWWGPGRHGVWGMTNNAPAFELLKISNAVAATPPGFLSFMGDTKFVLFLGRLDTQRIIYKDNGAVLDKNEKPMLFGIRLDFSPSNLLEMGFSQNIQFIDRREGYSSSYIKDLLLPSHESNEVEAESGPVANRVSSLDLSINLNRNTPILKAIHLEGMKLYWMVGGETMNSGGNSLNFPWFANTGNIFGLYMDSGKTDFRVEYATNYDASTFWYEHYQFRDGYRKDGFIMGHPHMVGNAKDIFISISRPLTGDMTATLYFDTTEQNPESKGPGWFRREDREDRFGMAVDAFSQKGHRVKLSYEYRDGDNPETVNQVWIMEAVYRF